MIDIQVRIHDRFSVEFKIGYVVHKEAKQNDFMMNTWIFLPSSLDINATTYSKGQFYRDVKSNIRLITPIYRLSEVADDQALPFMFLEGAFNELAVESTKENMSEYEYQIKMFTSIVKSALRKETDNIMKNSESEDRIRQTELYISYLNRIAAKYRRSEDIIHKPNVPPEAATYFSFGDEYLSSVIELHTYRLLGRLKKRYPDDYARLEMPLMNLIKQEIAYKKTKGYLVVEKDSPDRNRVLVFRLRMLKKYAESHLFLNASKKKDGRLAEQVYFSVAAGISMIFATAIAFSFQQKYGNFTMPLFVALVVSYMLKDRIKELARFYFVHRLAKKYFDNKTTVSIKETPVGWIKEGVDFITEDRVPEGVMEMRDRSDLLEANNRQTQEKIILYRKLVNIEGDILDEMNQYDISGINDIVRFNLSNLIIKMANPEIPLAVPSADGGYEVINGERIYYINFLVQLQYEGKTDYKRFRLVVSRDGIEGIEKLF